MTTRTNKMPKKDSVTTLRTKLRAAIANNDAAIAENVATKVENAALQKDLEDSDRVANERAETITAIRGTLTRVEERLASGVKENQRIRQLLYAASEESAFAPTIDAITNEPGRVLRLAFCSEKNQFSIIADREMLHVTLSVDELEALYDLLRLGPASA